jgi:hypothetical protein
MSKGPKPNEMIGHPEKLTEQHPDNLGPFRHFDSKKRFKGQKIRQIILDTREIINPVCVRDILVPMLSLPDLLRPSVMVAHVNVNIDDLFTIELGNQA